MPLRSLLLGGFAFACLAFSTPATAQDTGPRDVGETFDAALLGCEEWVLFPLIWADDPEFADFEAMLGPDDSVTRRAKVRDEVLPPEEFRQANHYWHMATNADAEIHLVTSDIQPMCHITGGGAASIMADVEALLGSPAFNARWKLIGDHSVPGMVSFAYSHVEEEKMVLVISYPQERLTDNDYLQVLATAVYNFGD